MSSHDKNETPLTEYDVLMRIKANQKVTNFLLAAIFGAVCLVAFLN